MERSNTVNCGCRGATTATLGRCRRAVSYRSGSGLLTSFCARVSMAEMHDELKRAPECRRKWRSASVRPSKVLGWRTLVKRNWPILAINCAITNDVQRGFSDSPLESHL
jgi:hypothetical protein